MFEQVRITVAVVTFDEGAGTKREEHRYDRHGRVGEDDHLKAVVERCRFERDLVLHGWSGLRHDVVAAPGEHHEHHEGARSTRCDYFAKPHSIASLGKGWLSPQAKCPGIGRLMGAVP